MGCTHSKNSKSKNNKSFAPPILNRKTSNPNQNTVAHFDAATAAAAANQKSQVADASMSRNILLNNNNNNSIENGETQRKGGLRQLKTVKMDAIAVDKERDRDAEGEEEEKERGREAEKRGQIPDDLRAEKDDATQTGQYFAAEKPAEIQKYAPSAYYPFPDKQNSPERKKAPIAQIMENNMNNGAVRVAKRKEVLNIRDNKTVAIAPTNAAKIYQPQLTQEDLDYIKRSVQQRNERRAYMMQHRNESDDTLYELEARMPEKDYTNLRVV